MVALFAALLLSVLATAAPADSRAAAGDREPSARAGKRAFVIGGARWPGREIRVFDRTPASYRKGVDTAIAEWNARGLRIRFRKVATRRAAQVVIAENRRIDSGGRATVGYISHARGWVDMNMPKADWADIAWVVSHELGHVLGLDHSDGCNVMSYSAYSDCGTFRGELWEWRCRLQERGDLRGIVRLYGGSFKVRTEPHCLLSPAAAPISALVAAPGDRERLATLSWAPAAGAFGYRLSRSEANGPCPKDIHQAEAVRKTTFDDRRWWDDAIAGRYCYSVWSVNKEGAPTGPAQLYVDYVPPIPAAVANVAATYLVDEFETRLVRLTWTPPPGVLRTVILRSDPNGACRSDPNDGLGTFVGGDGQVDDYGDYAFTSGTYCYTVLATDDPDMRRWSPPVTASVAVP
jgi:hypothetical protein